MTRTLLAGLFTVALALRLWGLSFGLPHSFSGDETNKRDAALQLAENGFRHTPNQPSFLYNSLFVLYEAAGVVRHDLTPSDYIYIGRLWMAVLGSLTVLAVWKLGSFFSLRIAWIGAALLAVMPLHTAVSRYIKEDAPLGFATAITSIAIVAYWKTPGRTRLVVMGLCAGFSASTKFTGALMLLPALLAIAGVARARREAVRSIAVDVVVVGVSTMVGFLLVSPIYIVHPQQLFDGLSYQGRYAAEGHDGIAISPWSEWWTYYIRTGLVPGMTWPALAAAAAGLWLILRERGGWIVTLTAVAFYVVLEQASAKPAPFAARYLTPLLPMMCVAAGAGLAALLGAVDRFRIAALGPIIVIAFLALPSIRSAFISDEANHDTRLRAGAWMDAHIPDGTRIVVVESKENLPVSDGWDHRWPIDNRADNMRASWDAPPPYFVVSSFRYDRFLERPDAVPANTAFYQTLARDFELVSEFQPRWFTYGKHSPVIRIYRPAAGAGRTEISKSAQLVLDSTRSSYVSPATRLVRIVKRPVEILGIVTSTNLVRRNP